MLQYVRKCICANVEAGIPNMLGMPAPANKIPNKRRLRLTASAHCRSGQGDFNVKLY